MAKILVIDDDPVFQALMGMQLAAQGHAVLTATDGESGLQLALVERPEVIIVDLMMPKIHGLAVIERIRSTEGIAAAKVIVCSVKSYPSDIRAAKESGADAFLKKPVQADQLQQTIAELLAPNRIRVKFWGTRGSIATPGPGTNKYGGNTACTEVRCGEHILILDAGTGIRELGFALLQEFGQKRIQAHIFVGHAHWDHIQGFPFFAPAYMTGNKLTLYSLRGGGKPLEKIFRGQMDGDYFPVVLSDLLGHLDFVELTVPVQIGPVTVGYEHLNHPGMAVGFRIEALGRSLVYVSDHETFSRLYGEEAGAREDARITEFCRNADLLIRDAQYTEEEYAVKKGWGHSTIDNVIAAAAQAEVKELALFHHDPTHSDAFMDCLLERCQQKMRERGYSFTCFAAQEGQTIEI